MVAARLPSRDDPHPHWFFALRGVLSLLAQNWMVLKQGPFGPLLDHRIDIETSDNPNDPELHKLKALFAPSAVTSSSLSDREICIEAYVELRRAFTLPYVRRRSWLDAKTAVYVWPGIVSEEFINLLFERKPETLILLAYYCVLLKYVDSCWYFKGLGVALLKAIENELSEEWRPWIAWAIKQPVS